MRPYKNSSHRKITTALFVVVAAISVGVFIYPGQHNDTREIDSMINQWIGRTLILPQNVGLFTTNGDTEDSSFPEERFKIVRYVGKEGCTSCRLHLNRYPEILAELSDSANCSVGFVCIVNPNGLKYIRDILHQENYTRLPIWIDVSDTINSLNQLPNKTAFQTFLLDKDNKILALGDPAVNSKVMQLYTQIVSNSTINSARLPITSLSVDNEKIQIGRIAAGDTISFSIPVKNIGRNTFALDKVLTSCDCTIAELSNESIAAGETATLSIRFSEPDAIGDFYRAVEISGNIAQELTIEFYGTVI